MNEWFKKFGKDIEMNPIVVIIFLINTNWDKRLILWISFCPQSNVESHFICSMLECFAMTAILIGIAHCCSLQCTPAIFQQNEWDTLKAKSFFPNRALGQAKICHLITHCELNTGLPFHVIFLHFLHTHPHIIYAKKKNAVWEYSECVSFKR